MHDNLDLHTKAWLDSVSEYIQRFDGQAMYIKSNANRNVVNHVIEAIWNLLQFQQHSSADFII